MIWSTLHSASQVLLLAGLLSVFFTTLIVWLKLRKHMRNEWKRLKEAWSYEEQIALASGKPLDSPHIPNMIKHWPLILVFVSGLPLAMYLWQMHVEYAAPVYEYRNVRVTHIIDKHHWNMVKDDGAFRADFCDDGQNDAVLASVNGQAGYTLDKFRFAVVGDCWDVSKDADLGFWWKKDSEGWALKETKQ